MEVATKRCPKCGQVKPVSEFHKDKRRKDGLRSRCKACRNEAKRRWRAAHPDKVRERNRRYRAAHPDKVREAKRRYYATHRDELSAYNRQWQAEHRDERSAYLKQRYFTYPERFEARTAVRAAVRNGSLPPASTQTCEKCGGQATEYHHPSYAVEDRLKVTPLCRSCHKRHHAKLRRLARQEADQAAVSQHQPDQAAHQPDQGTALSGQQAVSQEPDQPAPVSELIAFDLTPFIQLELQLEL